MQEGEEEVAIEDDAEYEENGVDNDCDDDDYLEDELQQDSFSDVLEDQDYDLNEEHDMTNQDEARHYSNTADEQLDKILDADRDQLIPATATAVMRFMNWRSENFQHLYDAGIKEPFNAEPDTIKATLFKILGQQLNRAKHMVALRLLHENDKFPTDIRLAHTSTWPVRKEVRDRRYRNGPDLLRGLPTIGGMDS